MSIKIPGNFLETAGTTLPTPYIRKIGFEDDGLKVTLSVYLKISDNKPQRLTDKMISQLSGKINTYLYITVRNERFNNIIDGKNNIIEYITQEEQIYILKDRASETVMINDTLNPVDAYIKIDDIFESTSDTDGNTSYTYLIDKDVPADDKGEGNSIWEFRIEKTIENRSIDWTVTAEKDPSYIEGLFVNYLQQNYYTYQIIDTMGEGLYWYKVMPIALEEYIESLSATYDSTSMDTESSALEQSSLEYFYNQVMDIGLHVCAFTTTIDLDDDDEIDLFLNNKTLLTTAVGSVSYETVLSSLMPAMNFDELGNHSHFSELWENLTLPAQTRIEYITTDDNIYDKTGLRTIGLTLHKSDLREEIVAEFESMGLSTTSNNRPQVEYMIEQINSVLTNYGNSEDLMPQLNNLRSYFPSKSSTTPVGKLYAEFKKKLYSLNARLKEESKLSKQVVRNPKISDRRTPPVEDYYSARDYIDHTTSAAEFIYPDWKVTTEYDDLLDVYTNYGFFFFDYEKALKKTSAIARVYDMDKLKAFGLDITYASFYIEEASIWRSDSDGDLAAKITSHFNTDSPAYPKTTSVYAENFTTDEKTLQFLGSSAGASSISAGSEAASIAGSAGAFGFVSDVGTTYIFPMLVHRALSRPTDAPTMKDFDPVTDTALPADYRLMLFEFQDLYHEPLYDSDYGYYNTSFTIVDNTINIVQQLESTYEAQMEGLSAYYAAASSWCSFNSDSGEFNQFFVDAMQELYESVEETAPWNTAPTTYAMFRDLFYDTYGGDKDKIAEEVAALSGELNPLTGNLEAIERFYERMNNLYDTMWGPYGAGEIRDLSDSFIEGRELTFESSQASSGHAFDPWIWPVPWVTVPECDYSSDDLGQSDCTENFGSSVYKCNEINKCVPVTEGAAEERL